MPKARSLFWKLAALLIAFMLLIIALSWFFSQRIEWHTSLLSTAARAQLQEYAEQGRRAWREGGAVAGERFLAELSQREGVWARLLDSELLPLGGAPLSAVEREHLTFMRQLDWPMSRRSPTLPYLDIPFADRSGHLVLQLPERFRPWEHREILLLLSRALVPALLGLLFCIGLYRVLIAPLVRLREQANALHADDLSARAGSVARRRDELGELARAFDHMAERLQATVSLQRQLLRDVSHELRTPLSRLRVAGESGLDAAKLSQRVLQEVDGMQRLVADTLELAWLDTERPRLTAEPVELVALWDVLVENLRFESGWGAERLRYEVQGDCRLHCNLNALAQALENVLRNAVRHSPQGGVLRLGGCREADRWQLWLSDEGPGVAADQLEAIFLPFTRLDGSRPGDGGFGLGLSIARSAIAGQGGRIWAENGGPGLRVCFQLPAA